MKKIVRMTRSKKKDLPLTSLIAPMLKGPASSSSRHPVVEEPHSRYVFCRARLSWFFPLDLWEPPQLDLVS